MLSEPSGSHTHQTTNQPLQPRAVACAVVVVVAVCEQKWLLPHPGGDKQTSSANTLSEEHGRETWKKKREGTRFVCLRLIYVGSQPLTGPGRQDKRGQTRRGCRKKKEALRTGDIAVAGGEGSRRGKSIPIESRPSPNTGDSITCMVRSRLDA